MNARVALMSFLVPLVAATSIHAQGIRKDSGHAVMNGNAILAAWNPEAGRDIPRNYDDYPEFDVYRDISVFPNLEGWDFRINLPHTRFQHAHAVPGSDAALVGVLEEELNFSVVEPPSPSQIRDYAHWNNSIWLFRIDSDRQLRYKVLPSRRDLNSSKTENVTSLTGGWMTVPAAPIPLEIEKPQVVVLGEGLGKATIYIIARAINGLLLFTKHEMTTTEVSVWSGLWRPLGMRTSIPPSLSQVFDGQLAVAWHDDATKSIRVSIYDPSTETWGPRRKAAKGDRGPLQLVGEPNALNLLFTKDERLQHVYSLEGKKLQFQGQSEVGGGVVVPSGHFHAMWFNERLHVVFRRDTGGPQPQQVWYTTSTTPGGMPSEWSIPSYTGLNTHGRPKLAWLLENIFVVCVGTVGQIKYSRKDPNRRGNDMTGEEFSDRWLEPGTGLDDGLRLGLGEPEPLSFNNDLYLAVNKSIEVPEGPVGTHVVNFGRAAMKHLLTDKWKLNMFWGWDGQVVKRGGGFAVGDEIPAIGDFNGDGLDDLIKFNQTAETDVGPAPVYVSLNEFDLDGGFGSNQLWHSFFSLEGEIPAVGDFNGDGKDDIVTFTQEAQSYSDGTPIGPAVVWVALSDGTKFETSRVWHTFFSLEGEIPAVGDFNGDGKDDIVTFTQQEQKYADGTVIGPAVVWVSLSDGTKFQTSEIWHTFFSLKGEMPRVGDFNGDGKDDIVTFTQEEQKYADGTVIGPAVVWVSISDGTTFQTSTIWHTAFSFEDEYPIVGDFNVDGKDDVSTLLRQKPGHGIRDRDQYVAFSLGDRFDRTNVWHQRFVLATQIPFVGSFTGLVKSTITGNPGDNDKVFADVFAFRSDGAVHVASSMASVPFAPGAPWENYKWFTDKVIGIAQFPEWIFLEGPNHCVSPEPIFALLGQAGFGGESSFASSVRAGGRAGHVLEEFGHSIFANCFGWDYRGSCAAKPGKDPFTGATPPRPDVASIFESTVEMGGFEAVTMDGCKDTDGCQLAPGNTRVVDFGLDCRDPEHYFLKQLIEYRVNPDAYRDAILAETDPTLRTRYIARYNWIKNSWFEGMEFRKGPAINGGLTQDGLPCLECVEIPPSFEAGPGAAQLESTNAAAR